MDASAITGSVVAVAGVTLAGWTQWSNSRLQRELAVAGHDHDRSLAHDGRLYESRRDIYIETLVFLNRLDLFMHLTEPIIGPVPDPPELPTDTEEGLLRSARLRAFGSTAVYEAVLEFNKKWPASERPCSRFAHLKRRDDVSLSRPLNGRRLR